MAVNSDVVNKPSKDILDKDVDFDEEEAFYELCEIISMAQHTGNYARFQSDLSQWKRHYPIDSFSDKYKSKIKYMLSEEFLSSVLKDYLMFEKYSQMDPSKQLDKLRKIYERAEKHKDPQKLDADLEALYKEYPLNLLQEKFPHIVSKLTSKSYREQILQKFDYEQAFNEFNSVLGNSENYSTVQELENALEPLRKKYPLTDFSDDYRRKLKPLLAEDSLKNIIEKRNTSAMLDVEELGEGTVIPLDFAEKEEELQQASSAGIFNQKYAYFELLEIMKDPTNVTGVFDWTYKYMKYIGRFDDYHKGLVLSTLLPYYKFQRQESYSIPFMKSKSDDYLSYDEYESINDIKRDSILQFLALISTSGDISKDDIERLEIIHSNSEKAEIVTEVTHSLEEFEQSNNITSLTILDKDYFDGKPQEPQQASENVDKSESLTDNTVIIPQQAGEDSAKSEQSQSDLDLETSVDIISDDVSSPNDSDNLDIMDDSPSDGSENQSVIKTFEYDVVSDEQTGNSLTDTGSEKPEGFTFDVDKNKLHNEDAPIPNQPVNPDGIKRDFASISPLDIDLSL